MIATLAQLRAVKCRAVDEPLVDLAKRGNGLLVNYRGDDPEVSGVWVRETVADKLCQIQKQLTQQDSRLQLLVVDGYRTQTYQEHYFRKQLLVEHSKYPNLSLDNLLEHVHQFVALPSVAGHPTGGAIDLTLACDGQEVDMGCGIADFSKPALLPTFSNSATPEQVTMRKLLHDLMCGGGFAPFYGEWWHYSYGDREWAVMAGHPEALYCCSRNFLGPRTKGN